MTNVVPVADRATGGAIIEQVIAKGDLAKLSPEERVQYYRAVCQSVGLNPLTRPFEYITLSGKLVLYARRDAADQLRKLNNISLSIVSQKIDGDLFTAHVRAETRDGRTDEDFGVVNIAGLRGEMRANAILKGITKAKRRVTLSIAGLGFLDESEVDDIEPRQPAEPQSVVAELDSFAAEPPDPDTLRLAGEAAALGGLAMLRDFYRPLTPEERELLAPHIDDLRRVASEVDERLRDADPFGLPPLDSPPANRKGDTGSRHRSGDTTAAETLPAGDTDAPELARSSIWDDESYAVALGHAGEAGPQWKEWSDRMGYLASEAATLAELDKLGADNKDTMSRARREAGDDWRHVRDVTDARRKALT